MVVPAAFVYLRRMAQLDQPITSVDCSKKPPEITVGMHGRSRVIAVTAEICEKARTLPQPRMAKVDYDTSPPKIVDVFTST